ncbi:IclR family transcriptional regulator [Conexibacter sp. S30A1]|uniref:IclR family transcriptional regulator n=1 Tax=Conexibacter sp. S30A1 TaxID=2937800 RepID=UPI00200D94C8|nr:IclR family transcriptional regulator C-terminal domain-containing protein [Conexibacter sp. S30A1]
MVDLVDPYLQSLRDETDENVKCAVVHGTELVYVAHYRSKSRPSRTAYIGTKIAAHTTSSGRAFYARLPHDVAERLIEQSPRPRLTPRTLTATGRIMAEVSRARELGYAVNDQGLSMEHRSVAAALVNHNGYPVGAINIAVWASLVSRAEMEERYAPKVVSTAAQISMLLPDQLEGFLESGELLNLLPPAR